MENKEEKIDGLDAEIEKETTITLISGQDQQKFTMEKKYARQSTYLQTMIDSDRKANEFIVHEVSGKILSKVIEYLSFHYGNPVKSIERPLKSANLSEVVCDFDAKFIDLEQEQLFNITLAANFMDIPQLLDLACAKIASFIKGKNTQQIREIFNIQSDFTQEEEAQILAENKWAKDE